MRLQDVMSIPPGKHAQNTVKRLKKTSCFDRLIYVLEERLWKVEENVYLKKTSFQGISDIVCCDYDWYCHSASYK